MLLELGILRGSSVNLVDLLRLTNTERLLGDAVFESRYIEDQIYAQTGYRYLDTSLSNSTEQLLALYEAALEAKENLGLELGQSLSKRQQEGLQSDIVWLERKQVNDKWVLTPTLYLSKKTKDRIAFRDTERKRETTKLAYEKADKDHKDALRNNKDSDHVSRLKTQADILKEKLSDTDEIIVHLNKTRAQRSSLLSGSSVNIVSTGTLALNEGLLLANDELNLRIKGKDANKNSIVNNYGIIEAGNLNIEVAGHIKSKALEVRREETDTSSSHDSYDSYEKYRDIIADYKVSTLRATKANTNSIVKSREGDIYLGAGSLVGAKDSLELDAGGDIKLDYVSLERKEQWSKSGRKTSKCNIWTGCKITKWKENFLDYSLRHEAVDINIGGDLSFKSGGDINIYGSDLNVGGNMAYELKNGGDLKEYALKNRNINDYNYVAHSYRKGGFLGGIAGLIYLAGDVISTTLGGIGSLGGKNSDWNKLFSGVSGIATGILSVPEMMFKEQEIEQKEKGSTRTNAEVVELNVGGDFSLIGSSSSDKETSAYLLGSQHNVAGNYNVEGVKNFNVLSVENEEHTTSKSVSNLTSFFFRIKNREKEHNRSAIVNQFAQINVGGNLSIDANEDVIFKGVHKNIGGDLTINARNIRELAVFDREQVYSKVNKGGTTGLDLSFLNSWSHLEKFVSGKNDFLIDENDWSIKLALIKYSGEETVTRENNSYVRQGTIQVGGALNYNASQNIQFLSQQVTAEDISLTAVGDVSILSAKNILNKTKTKKDQTGSLNLKLGNAYVDVARRGVQIARSLANLISTNQIVDNGSKLGSHNYNHATDEELLITGISAGVLAWDTFNFVGDLTSVLAGTGEDAFGLVSTAPFFGFYLSTSLDLEEQITKTQSKNEQVVGSVLDSKSNINITSDSQINIKASHLVADNNIVLSALKGVHIGVEEENNFMESDTQTVSLSIELMSTKGTSFSPDMQASFSSSNSSSTRYVGSSLKAGSSLKIKSGKDFSLISSQVKTKNLAVDVAGSSRVESLQDVSQSNSRSTSLGTSFSKSSIGINTGGSRSSSYKKWTNSLASITADKGHLNTTGSLSLVGAALRSGISVAADDVRVANLKDIDRSSSHSYNVSLNFNLPAPSKRKNAKDNETRDISIKENFLNTTTLGLSYSTGHSIKEGTTRATVSDSIAASNSAFANVNTDFSKWQTTDKDEKFKAATGQISIYKSKIVKTKKYANRWKNYAKYRKEGLDAIVEAGVKLKERKNAISAPKENNDSLEEKWYTYISTTAGNYRFGRKKYKSNYKPTLSFVHWKTDKERSVLMDQFLQYNALPMLEIKSKELHSTFENYQRASIYSQDLSVLLGQTKNNLNSSLSKNQNSDISFDDYEKFFRQLNNSDHIVKSVESSLELEKGKLDKIALQNPLNELDITISQINNLLSTTQVMGFESTFIDDVLMEYTANSEDIHNKAQKIMESFKSSDKKISQLKLDINAGRRLLAIEAQKKADALAKAEEEKKKEEEEKLSQSSASLSLSNEISFKDINAVLLDDGVGRETVHAAQLIKRKSRLAIVKRVEELKKEISLKKAARMDKLEQGLLSREDMRRNKKEINALKEELILAKRKEAEFRPDSPHFGTIVKYLQDDPDSVDEYDMLENKYRFMSAKGPKGEFWTPVAIAAKNLTKIVAQNIWTGVTKYIDKSLASYDTGDETLTGLEVRGYATANYYSKQTSLLGLGDNPHKEQDNIQDNIQENILKDNILYKFIDFIYINDFKEIKSKKQETEANIYIPGTRENDRLALGLITEEGLKAEASHYATMKSIWYGSIIAYDIFSLGSGIVQRKALKTPAEYASEKISKTIWIKTKEAIKSESLSGAQSEVQSEAQSVMKSAVDTKIKGPQTQENKIDETLEQASLSQQDTRFNMGRYIKNAVLNVFSARKFSTDDAETPEEVELVNNLQFSLPNSGYPTTFAYGQYGSIARDFASKSSSQKIDEILDYVEKTKGSNDPYFKDTNKSYETSLRIDTKQEHYLTSHVYGGSPIPNLRTKEKYVNNLNKLEGRHDHLLKLERLVESSRRSYEHSPEDLDRSQILLANIQNEIQEIENFNDFSIYKRVSQNIDNKRRKKFSGSNYYYSLSASRKNQLEKEWENEATDLVYAYKDQRDLRYTSLYNPVVNAITVENEAHDKEIDIVLQEVDYKINKIESKAKTLSNSPDQFNDTYYDMEGIASYGKKDPADNYSSRAAAYNAGIIDLSIAKDLLQYAKKDSSNSVQLKEIKSLEDRVSRQRVKQKNLVKKEISKSLNSRERLLRNKVETLLPDDINSLVQNTINKASTADAKDMAKLMKTAVSSTISSSKAYRELKEEGYTAQEIQKEAMHQVQCQSFDLCAIKPGDLTNRQSYYFSLQALGSTSDFFYDAKSPSQLEKAKTLKERKDLILQDLNNVNVQDDLFKIAHSSLILSNGLTTEDANKAVHAAVSGMSQVPISSDPFISVYDAMSHGLAENIWINRDSSMFLGDKKRNRIIYDAVVKLRSKENTTVADFIELNQEITSAFSTVSNKEEARDLFIYAARGLTHDVVENLTIIDKLRVSTAELFSSIDKTGYEKSKPGIMNALWHKGWQKNTDYSLEENQEELADRVLNIEVNKDSNLDGFLQNTKLVDVIDTPLTYISAGIEYTNKTVSQTWTKDLYRSSTCSTNLDDLCLPSMDYMNTVNELNRYTDKKGNIKKKEKQRIITAFVDNYRNEYLKNDLPELSDLKKIAASESSDKKTTAKDIFTTYKKQDKQLKRNEALNSLVFETGNKNLVYLVHDKTREINEELKNDESYQKFQDIKEENRENRATIIKNYKGLLPDKEYKKLESSIDRQAKNKFAHELGLGIGQIGSVKRKERQVILTYLDRSFQNIQNQNNSKESGLAIDKKYIELERMKSLIETAKNRGIVIPEEFISQIEVFSKELKDESFNAFMSEAGDRKTRLRRMLLENRSQIDELRKATQEVLGSKHVNMSALFLTGMLSHLGESKDEFEAAGFSVEEALAESMHMESCIEFAMCNLRPGDLKADEITFLAREALGTGADILNDLPSITQLARSSLHKIDKMLRNAYDGKYKGQLSHVIALMSGAKSDQIKSALGGLALDIAMSQVNTQSDYSVTDLLLGGGLYSNEDDNYYLEGDATANALYGIGSNIYDVGRKEINYLDKISGYYTAAADLKALSQGTNSFEDKDKSIIMTSRGMTNKFLRGISLEDRVAMGVESLLSNPNSSVASKRETTSIFEQLISGSLNKDPNQAKKGTIESFIAKLKSHNIAIYESDYYKRNRKTNKDDGTFSRIEDGAQIINDAILPHLSLDSILGVISLSKQRNDGSEIAGDVEEATKGVSYLIQSVNEYFAGKENTLGDLGELQSATSLVLGRLHYLQNKENEIIPDNISRKNIGSEKELKKDIDNFVNYGVDVAQYLTNYVTNDQAGTSLRKLSISKFAEKSESFLFDTFNALNSALRVGHFAQTHNPCNEECKREKRTYRKNYPSEANLLFIELYSNNPDLVIAEKT